MPRLTKAVPKYQKHRASGQAVVRLNGQDFYLGPHGTKASKIEYGRLTSWQPSTGRFSAPRDTHSFQSLQQRLVEQGHARTYINHLGSPIRRKCARL